MKFAKELERDAVPGKYLTSNRRAYQGKTNF